MQNASISIPSNIAEGCERHHTPEYIQFTYVSLGSCAELYTQLKIARKRNYIDEKCAEAIEKMIVHERRMLLNLIKSLKKKKKR